MIFIIIIGIIIYSININININIIIVSHSRFNIFVLYIIFKNKKYKCLENVRRFVDWVIVGDLNHVQRDNLQF